MALFNFRGNKTPQATAPIQNEEIHSSLETLIFRGIEMPKPQESKAQDWVLFGQHNRFPLELLEYKNGSAIHSAIIESKSKIIMGNGFIFGDDREKSDEWLQENFKAVPFWRKLDTVGYMVARDQQIFGYSAFEVIYSLDHTRIVDINWIDASRLACGKRNEFGQVCHYYYSENWSDVRQCPPRKIQVWDPNNTEEVRQLVVIKNQDNNMDYYSLPSYFSAMKWIKANAMMADYNLSALQNGFSPSIVFKFFKKPTPEERRLTSDGIKQQFSGSKNAGKALIFFSDGRELAPEVTTLDATNIDQRLLQVAEQITQEIVTAHRVSPAICGIQVPGKLGYSNELLQSWKIFQTLVVAPERKLIVDAFKSVLIYNGVTRLHIEELEPIEIIQ